MARVDVLHHALNIGVFDRDKLHRVDIERMRLAAERQTNMLCDAVGQAFLRPGTQFIANLDGPRRPIEFVAGNDDAALLLLGNMTMRVFDDQAGKMVSRVAVATTIQNGTDFASGTGWTLSTASGQSTAIASNALTMSARAHGATAKATATASVAGGDQGKEHGLRIVVARGPVQFRLGSSSGADDLIRESSLRTGVHSLSFIPTGGTIYIQFTSSLPISKIVTQCQIEAAGVMELPTVWPEAALDLVRTAQSLDVMFCAADGYREQRIERRNDTAWSVVDYDREDGPFQFGRSGDVTLQPSVTEGNGTLTASSDFFKPGHVGALFRLFHTGQLIETWLVGQGSETTAFMLDGITETNFEERKFTTEISGTWAGTLRHKRSYEGEFGGYYDYRREQASAVIDITSNATFTNDDNDDNMAIWVKVGFAAYTSGEARVVCTYGGGGGYGICRVVKYNSPTSVDIEVLRPFMGKAAVTNWRQSRYDGVQGYPAAVAFVDGRLSWSGDDLFDASVSDAYDSFDETFDGDAGPLSRSLALGGRNDVRWALPLSSLMLGCDSRIANVRASSLDEIMTPDNFGMKSSGAVGAAAISPVELADDRAVYVEQAGVSLYEITWSAEKGRYITAPFSKLTTDLFRSGIRNLAVQVIPDQRIWATVKNGMGVCIVFEPTQQVLAAHVPISTSTNTDFFQYFAVLPDEVQDRVYAVVKRVVNDATVYYLERMARDDEVRIGPVCKVMDSHVTGTGAHGATIDLPHLVGRQVVAWVDGEPVIDPTITDPELDNSMVFVVENDGTIELPVAPTSGWCVGLRYVGQYKSSRLAYGVQGYTPMLKNKGLAALGLMLGDYCRSGVRYGTVRGSGFEAPYSLPELSDYSREPAPEVVAGPDEDEYPVATVGEFGLDVRLCVSCASPKPMMLRSLVLAIETYP